MTANPRKMLTYKDYTVAIICPLPIELDAAWCLFDEEHEALAKKGNDPNGYFLGEMSGHNVAVAYFPYGDQGIGAASAVASNMAWAFPSAKLRLLVGLGGGVRSKRHDIHLGDVVVGMPDGTHGGVVQWNLGKATTHGFERKGHVNKAPDEWRYLAVAMMARHRHGEKRFIDFLMNMQSKYPNKFSRPPPGQDVLFSPDQHHVGDGLSCEEAECVRRYAATPSSHRDPQVHYGTIASGDEVVKDAVKRDTISRENGGVLCVEMEAAKLPDIFPCIVIRGICDYADSHKNDQWHPYAAAVAVAFAKELLTHIPPPIRTSAS
ncbi:hypothetical protein LTR10_018764 [Elasticomyces elasticus]|uniref:Nucleoside phosphorylase domain-containing protein n=1 Tax=Exophiala sideris TaxID=1016849 RepID=A0ABR0J7X3_9EURO|nr:hypothetical protein LTR10_018764 [Elasticomyces elasticus]KAK5029890.1 hypothetical protein LTS07_005614 [Exophiala sideris]KAK5031670.1 hypothetical protein LTR13_007660 [Exophiala sideris]KAK5058348.1 hypothetical protein LTR69_006753 [Exophiala sideris]KAK5180277.1 hypothetical protein LTR44_007403 [Eurotiomycetes sp. CCFEE 6388]